MKILMITASDLSENHGPVIHFVETCKAFHNLKNDITAIAPSPQKKILPFPFQTIFLNCSLPLIPQSLIYQIKLLFFLIKTLPSFSGTIYVRHSSYMIIPQIIAKILKKHLTVEINGLCITQHKISQYLFLKRITILLFEKISFQLADKLICVTQGLKDLVATGYKIEKNKIQSFSNGVNTLIYKPDSQLKKPSFFENHTYFDSLLVYSGTLEKWQGLDFLINVIERLKTHYQDFNLLIIGNGTQRKNLEAKVRQKKLTETIIFLGEKNEKELVNILNTCLIGLLPIYHPQKLIHDLSPMKLYTYLSMGLPVIGTRMKGTEIIEQSNSGFCIEPEDIDGFVEKILLLLKDRNTVKKMSLNARQLAVERFDWNLIGSQIITFLKS